jgi:hypothetical protein
MSKTKDKTAADDPKRRARATKAEMIQRRERVEELLVMGYRRRDIVEKMEVELEIGEAQVDKLISYVYDSWEEEKKVERENKRAAQERRLLLYIKRADKIRDKARCEAIYAKIVGTEAPTKIEGADGGPVKIVCEVVDYRAPETKKKGEK